MVKRLLNLERTPQPDHAADALAAAICYTTHDGLSQAEKRFDEMVAAAQMRRSRAWCMRVPIDKKVAR